MAGAESILFVDAYDSFAQNIIALLNEELDVKIIQIKIDTDIEQKFETSLADLITRFDAIVLGPGPGDPNNPKDVGLLNEVFDAARLRRVPILGICLGFQVLCIKHGLRVEPMKEPCHGQPKSILRFRDRPMTEDDGDIFSGIKIDELQATCYNSLGVTLSNVLDSPNMSRPGSAGTNASFSTASSQSSARECTALCVLAVDCEDNIMAVGHRQLPFWGVQFHPESCKSNDACRRLIRNWWAIVRRGSRRNSKPKCNNNVSSDSRIRKIDCPLTDPFGPIDASVEVPTSSAVSEIVSQLLSISHTSESMVQWKSIITSCNPEQVAGIIHDLCGTCHVAMLESTKKGRFSVYAVTARSSFPSEDCSTHHPFTSWELRYSKSKLSVVDRGSVTSFRTTATRQDVWHALDSFLVQRRAINGSIDIPFWGGFVGYLSYEHGLDTLGVRPQGPASRSVPEISLLWVERSVVYDNLTKTVFVQSIRKGDYSFIEKMVTLLSTPSDQWPQSHLQARRQRENLRQVLKTAQFSLPNEEQYKLQFQQCQSELRRGNSYELCLTTEATITVLKSLQDANYEYELYRNLHSHNPVPFGAYLKLAGITILGTSPEQYMSWSRTGVIDMIPMKGTVKRSADMTYERASAILSSPKESAENLMIADLIRHDLYNAIGHTSKVEVVKLCEVVEHETVYQLVSHIQAHAPIDKNLNKDEKQAQAIHYGLKTLQTTLPPGSMTGAPKKRSCEILSGLEKRNRGIYSGVVGYIDVGGGGNWSVCIRTAFRCNGESHQSKDGTRHTTSRDKDNDTNHDSDIWHLGAGGAITVLSDAEGEWQEMMVKLDSVLQGFKIVKDAENC